MGKKGSLSEVLKGLGAASPEERPKIGAVANEWKRKVETALEERKRGLENAEPRCAHQDRADRCLGCRPASRIEARCT